MSALHSEATAHADYRRRQFHLGSPAQPGTMAALAFGPESRPVDLVFAHANGFNAMTYRRLLAPLGAAGWHVLAIDQRGHGRSQLAADPDPVPHSWLRYRDDLLALFEQLGGAPRVLAGHSMGGTASLLASASLRERGARVPSLVLFDPVLMPAGADEQGDLDWTAPEHSPLVRGALRRNDRFDSPEAALASYRGRGAFKTWPEAVIADYLEDGLLPQPDGSWRLSCAPAWEAANFIRAHRSGLPAAMAAQAGPLRVLRAEIETTAPWTHWPAQARVQTVQGSTHFLPMEFAEQARAALQQALAGDD
ncbi:alpha/beta fold hydrolase [Xenophilus arseniciresistens]|uniref:Alpha/beta fold hydrolase n=1 Tax=Xenophilus arseniciresistens TaxID=1283306 RepID=A0AAE3NBZ8_9BURK|nr:alpha/beta fold hydrolase [Xenophilus arseniciresistens]MDA7416804.1 alpha/beta fold hydrolase [Xenophilus arseniciresistens]